MVSDRAFIFHMTLCIPWCKTLFGTKVICRGQGKNYKGHIFFKNGCCRGIHVSQTHLFLCGRLFPER